MTIEEPLLEIAPLAAEIAARDCHTDAGAGGTCAWYHGIIDTLRLLGVVSSPAEDSAFLVPTIERLAREEGFRRVLISGAGDCAMLTQILTAFAAAGATPSIALFDRCATPVQLNRWFAERNGVTIQTAVSDAVDYVSDEPFDLICTHCFLGYFTPQERPALFAKWFDLLRPGGRIVTVNPVRPAPEDTRLGFNAEQQQSFVQRALEAARDKPEAIQGAPINGDLSELQRRVAAFTASFGSYPIPSMDALTGQFEAGGFVIEHCAPLSPPDGAGSGAPSERGPAYHSVVAIRP